MRGSCHLGIPGQCLDIADGSPERRCCGDFTTMGETAVRRQILPGYLRIINHKEAKVPLLSRRDHPDAHLRTKRHHGWIAREPYAANQFDRLLAAGSGAFSRRAAL